MKASSESGECASLISITRVVACLMAIALPEKLQLPVTFPYCVPRPDFLRLNGPAESPCATRVPWSRARRIILLRSRPNRFPQARELEAGLPRREALRLADSRTPGIGRSQRQRVTHSVASHKCAGPSGEKVTSDGV